MLLCVIYNSNYYYDIAQGVFSTYIQTVKKENMKPCLFYQTACDTEYAMHLQLHQVLQRCLRQLLDRDK